MLAMSLGKHEGRAHGQAARKGEKIREPSEALPGGRMDPPAADGRP